MKPLNVYQLKLFLISCVMLATSAFSSDVQYIGPVLKMDYSGPIIVHNSHYKYTASDRLTFYTKDYLAQNIPHLLPLRESIDTWAAINSIHPRLLSEILKNHFKDKNTDASFDNKQLVFEVATGLNKGFSQNKNNLLSASIAVNAIVNAYGIKLNLGSEFIEPRNITEHDYFKGNSGPPLYSYYQPPWPRGELWAGGGVHSNTGGGSSPRNSLDFFESYLSWGGDTSNIWVSASNAGIARVYSECFVQVVHPNGWVSGYYHLENILINDFDNVKINQKLSNYADDLMTATCQGGSSTGPHVHFSIYYDGDAIEIDESNVDFSSWKHQAGVGQYDGDCDNSIYTLMPGNTTICPYSLQLPNNTLENPIFANGFE